MRCEEHFARFVKGDHVRGCTGYRVWRRMRSRCSRSRWRRQNFPVVLQGSACHAVVTDLPCVLCTRRTAHEATRHALLRSSQGGFASRVAGWRSASKVFGGGAVAAICGLARGSGGDLKAHQSHTVIAKNRARSKIAVARWPIASTLDARHHPAVP